MCFKCAYVHAFACMAVFWSPSWINLHNPWTMKENCEAKTKPIFETPISSLQGMHFTNAVRVCACVCVRTCVWIRIRNGLIIAKNHFLTKSIFCLILILIIIATFNKYFFPLVNNWCSHQSQCCDETLWDCLVVVQHLKNTTRTHCMISSCVVVTRTVATKKLRLF